MSYPRIRQAKAIDAITLLVEFDNQVVKQYDVRKLLANPAFALLRQPACFKHFTIAEGGYGLVWNEDLDISEYELWQYGVTVTDRQLIDALTKPSLSASGDRG